MKRIILRLTLAVLLLLAIHLPATQFTPVQLEDLTAKAQLVLQGTVLSKSCQQDDAGRIYTRVELQVAEVWKGTLATNRFTLVHSGGILGDQKAVVSGQADYQIGEEVVVFLVLNQRGEGVSLGLARGKFHIQQDPATGEKLAQNPFHGSLPPPVTEKSKARIATIQPGSVNGLKLADLKQRVTSGKP